MNKVIRLYSVGYSFSTKVAFFVNKVFGNGVEIEMGRWREGAIEKVISFASFGFAIIGKGIGDNH